MVLSLGSDPGAGQRCSRAVGKIAEPVTEERCRRGCSVFMPEGAVRQISAQCRPSFRARASLEACKPLLSLDVEIAGREGRIGVALARKKAGDVAQIFPLQRHRLIFGMSLEEDELAAQLLGEDIDAAFRRMRQVDRSCARSSLRRECETLNGEGRSSVSQWLATLKQS